MRHSERGVRADLTESTGVRGAFGPAQLTSPTTSRRSTSAGRVLDCLPERTVTVAYTVEPLGGLGRKAAAVETAGFGLTWQVLRLRRSELRADSVAAGGLRQAVLEEDARTNP